MNTSEIITSYDCLFHMKIDFINSALKWPFRICFSFLEADEGKNHKSNNNYNSENTGNNFRVLLLLIAFSTSFSNVVMDGEVTVVQFFTELGVIQ